MPKALRIFLLNEHVGFKILLLLVILLDLSICALFMRDLTGIVSMNINHGLCC